MCKNVKALNKAEENIIESSPMSAPSFHSGNENSKSLRNKKKKSDIMDKSHIQPQKKFKIIAHILKFYESIFGLRVGYGNLFS